VEFADHRAYAPGDDPRFIDWHLYGRAGLLFTKEYSIEEQGEAAVVVDISASMGPKLRPALRLAAALAVAGLARGDRVRVGAARDGGLRTGRVLSGDGKRGEVLASLSALEGRAGGRTDLDASLRCLAPLPGPGRGLVVLISDLLAERDGRRTLSARREDRAVLHLLSPEDRAPPALGRVRLVSEEDGELDVHVGPPEAERLSRECGRWCGEIRASLLRAGALYVTVPSEWPTEEVFLGLLRREGLLS
jgi:uncharacterized protein (DUF58 family)